MVKETRHIFDLTDIKAVRLQCNKCQVELVQRLEKSQISLECPTCETRWLPQSGTSDISNLIHYAKRIVQYGNEPLTIRFEIDGEED